MREGLRGPNKQPSPCSKVGLMGKKPGFRTLSTNLDTKLAQLQCPGSPSAPISLLCTEPVPATQIEIQRGWGAGRWPRTILGFSTVGKCVQQYLPSSTQELLGLFLYPQPREDIKNMAGSGLLGHG